MNKSKLFLGLIVGILSLPVVFAASDDLTNHPGFVDFTSLAAVAGGEPTVEVSLKEPLLAMITNILRNNDEEAADFISKLLRVNVQVYENTGFDALLMAQNMSNIARDLEAEEWERVVRVREGNNHVDVYFKLSGGADLIHGIAIMVTEPGQAVMVNIVGDISATDLSTLGRRFDIDELANLDYQDQDADDDVSND
ncbi:MAG: DUF4252 domain-containing protein [Pseudohongiellaceae bacterium]